MDNSTHELVRKAIRDILTETFSDRSIKDSFIIHNEKLHFVPVQYRVLGGLLQSLNIKFGNVIERIIDLIIRNEPHLFTQLESRKKIAFRISPDTDSLIDRYITRRQQGNSPDDCTSEFQSLLNDIIVNENSYNGIREPITHDVDALFKTQFGEFIYLEVKYNDDHDTGKFVDINRKFLKTYAGLAHHLGIKSASELRPILYYFNPTKRWGPIYTPSKNIHRGQTLFDEFFTTRFDDVHAILKTINEDSEILSEFDLLYRQVRNINSGNI